MKRYNCGEILNCTYPFIDIRRRLILDVQSGVAQFTPVDEWETLGEMNENFSCCLYLSFCRNGSCYEIFTLFTSDSNTNAFKCPQKKNYSVFFSRSVKTKPQVRTKSLLCDICSTQDVSDRCEKMTWDSFIHELPRQVCVGSGRAIVYQGTHALGKYGSVRQLKYLATGKDQESIIKYT